MKKIGIAADNFKLERFKKELEKVGFKDYEIVAFTKDTSVIHIKIPESEFTDENLKKIKRICQQVEFHFKRAN